MIVSISNAWGRALASHGAYVLTKIGALHNWRRSARVMGGACVFLIGLVVRIEVLGVDDPSFPYLTYLPGVAVAAALFGPAGGLMTVALALAAAHPNAPGGDALGWLRLIGFSVSSLVIIAAADLARDVQARLHAAGLARQNEAQLSHFIEQAPDDDGHVRPRHALSRGEPPLAGGVGLRRRAHGPIALRGLSRNFRGLA